MVSPRIRDLSRTIRRVPGVRKVLEASDPRRRAQLIAKSGLVDARLYAAQIGVESMTVEEAATHYAARGFRDDLTVNVLLDPHIVRWNTFRTGRPPIYDYLNARAWYAEVSSVWNREKYVADHPEAADHAQGPVGHLWDRVRSDPSTRVLIEPGGRRTVAWQELYPALFDASVEWAAQQRGRRTRHASHGLEHPRALDDLALPAQGPTVSIVLPTWNRPGGLRRAVDSVIAQSWPWWQLIIVDDGSWDDTPEIGRLIAARDERIEFVSREHTGVCATRNAGIRRATGEYIAFLDSDNQWEPSFLRDVVTEMMAHDVESAYATVEIVDADGAQPRFRTGASDLASLRQGNSIDMNVLIARLDAVREIGGFDESLRRAVDYDLILKLAARSAPLHVPTVGVVYDNSDESADRISVTEALGWNALVRLNNEEPPSGADLLPGTSVVVVTDRHNAHLPAKLKTIASARPDTSVQIAAVDPRPDEWRSIAAAAIGREHLSARLYQEDDPWAYVANLTARSADRERLLFVDPSTWLSDALFDALLEAGGQQDNFMPLTIGLDGALEAAGSVFVGPRSEPARLFAGHPVEDAQAQGDPYDVPALTGRTLGVPTRAFHAVGGFDPLLFNAHEAEGLSLRLRAGAGATFSVRSRIVVPQMIEDPVAFRTLDPHGTAQQLRALTPGIAATDTAPFYDRLDQEAQDWRVGDAFGRLYPTLTRRRRTATLPDGSVVPRLRWSIRTAAPAGPKNIEWGDTHFAQSLAAAFAELGQDAVVDSRAAEDRRTRGIDDVQIVLRGLDRVVPASGQLSFLWVISHPDLVTRYEAESYDRVFAASLSWSAKTSRHWGLDVSPLLQCTDPARFHPRGTGRTDDILFVGQSRGIPRLIVMEAVRSGVPVTVYGEGWNRFLPASSIAGKRIDNRELSALYESASVVLNDHWADMKREGFISNRLFDVVASGGRGFSDDIDGIAEIFGGAVRTFPAVSQIGPLLRGDHDRLFAPPEELAVISERIRAEHSFLVRARQLLDAAIAAGA